MKRIAIALVAFLLLSGSLTGSLTGCAVSSSRSEATLPPETPAPTEEPTENLTEPETEPDKTVPDFRVQNKNGETVNLSDFFGKPIIVNFWATWCGPCKLELPDFDEMYQTYGERIEFLMIDLCESGDESIEGALAFIDSMGYTFPVYFDVDSIASAAYGISSIPATFFINEKGELVTYAVGMLDAETLQKGINMLLPTD